MSAINGGWLTASRFGAILTLVGLIIYAMIPSLPWAVLLAGGILLLASSCILHPRNDYLGITASALVGSLIIYSAIPRPTFVVWPAYLLIPIIAAGVVARIRGGRAAFFAIAVKGRFGRQEWFYVVAIAVVTAIALVGWVWFLSPDVDRQRDMLPDWPLGGLILAGLAFSTLNAMLEEFLWRGVLLRWLMTFLSPVGAVAIQAISFGAAHFMGFPSGFVGVGLAAIYATMLGALAVRSGGLLAAVVAHIAADLVIVTLLVVL